MTAVLLDTCVAIWLAEGMPIAAPALDAIVAAARDGGVFVSPVSAWEVGLLSAKGRMRFRPDAETWFARLMTGAGIVPVPFTAEIAIRAAFLPGEMHGDPADRLLVATARKLNVRLVTRDTRLMANARTGEMRALAA